CFFFFTALVRPWPFPLSLHDALPILARLLLGGAPNTPPSALLSGLELLAQLDTRQALQSFRGPQLHLFAGLDGLVPANRCNCGRSEEHTSELQSRGHLVCRLLLEKKK